jgi:pSer/pThr/pTyr-binding forkhead associated (FHA) protein
MALAVLIVEGGPNRGTTIKPVKRATIIGRDEFNDIVVAEPTISERHAAIMEFSDGYWISDLDSPTGTFVNGEAVTRDQRKWRRKHAVAGSHGAGNLSGEPLTLVLRPARLPWMTVG